MLPEEKKQFKKAKHHAYFQVGVAKVVHKPKDRDARYSDVPRDDFGWVTDLRFRPLSFDLVFLRVKDRDKPVSAWWTGHLWDGRLWKPEYKVLAWKRNENWD